VSLVGPSKHFAIELNGHLIFLFGPVIDERLFFDGFVFFVGRRSEMLKVGGLRVYPLEIEVVLHGHPEVRDVVVVGAGNAAFESALQLAAYCKSVTIFSRTDNFRADEVTVEAVNKNTKIRILTNVEITEVLGDKFVTSLKYKNTSSGEEVELPIAGIFVEIGQIPNTDLAKNVCKIDSLGRIEINPWTQATSTPGIWSAGDCTNIRYHQNNIAAGNGVTALEDIYQYIQRLN
jgi:thioredoxin reductase